MIKPFPQPTVATRADFVAFVTQLRQDLNDNPTAWENHTLDDFLQALSAYAGDIQGYYNNTQQPINADEPRWQTFADMLCGASVYE